MCPNGEKSSGIGIFISDRSRKSSFQNGLLRGNIKKNKKRDSQKVTRGESYPAY